MKRNRSREHPHELSTTELPRHREQVEDSWPERPTFENMCRFVQARLAGPEHDAAMEEHRRFEERWAAMTEEQRAAAWPTELIGAIDDPTFPRSTHFHEDFYGDGGKR